MYAQSFLTTLALATLALSAPTPLQIRTTNGHNGSQPRQPASVTEFSVKQQNESASVFAADPSVYTTTNWAGLAQYSGANSSIPAPFISVFGAISLPKSASPGAGSGPWYDTYWVGIDGTTNGNALLQAGVTTTVDTDGSQTFTPWIEFYPDPLIWLDDFSMNAGDTIFISVTADTPTSGTFIISDTTTNQSVTKTLAAPGPDNVLTGQSAEWILEKFTIDGGLAPFAAFDEAVFSFCGAGTSDGQLVGVQDAETIVLSQDGVIVTDVQAVGDFGMTVTYTGPV